MDGTGDPMNRALDELDQAERERDEAQGQLANLRVLARALLDELTENDDLRVPLGGPGWERLRGLRRELADELDGGVS